MKQIPLQCYIYEHRHHLVHDCNKNKTGKSTSQTTTKETTYQIPDSSRCVEVKWMIEGIPVTGQMDTASWEVVCFTKINLQISKLAYDQKPILDGQMDCFGKNVIFTTAYVKLVAIVFVWSIVLSTWFSVLSTFCSTGISSCRPICTSSCACNFDGSTVPTVKKWTVRPRTEELAQQVQLPIRQLIQYCM